MQDATRKWKENKKKIKRKTGLVEKDKSGYFEKTSSMLR